MKKITGLLAAPFTPFTESGAVAYDLIEKQAEALIADGVKGAYICGTTGEGISCTLQERKNIMKRWQEVAQGKLTLIAHTGALALEESKELSRYADSLGYDAFSVIPTTFFRPTTEQSLVNYCKEVASTAPNLPFYYYHTMNANVPLNMVKFLELADGVIPNLAGIKFNHHNLYDYQNCLNYKEGKFDIVFGVDEFFTGALALGAKGFIGSTYNYSASLYQQIWTAYDAHDEETVTTLMKKVCQGVDILVERGGIPAGKAMMLLKGIDCGKARLPLPQYELGERKAIAKAMGEIIGL